MYALHLSKWVSNLKKNLSAFLKTTFVVLLSVMCTNRLFTSLPGKEPHEAVREKSDRHQDLRPRHPNSVLELCCPLKQRGKLLKTSEIRGIIRWSPEPQPVKISDSMFRCRPITSRQIQLKSFEELSFRNKMIESLILRDGRPEAVNEFKNSTR